MKIVSRILSSLEYRIEDAFGLARLQVLLYKAGQSIPTQTDSPFTIKIATEETLKPICNSNLDMSCSFLSNALKKNDVCIVAMLDKKVIGYSWLSQSNTVFDGNIWVRPPTNSYYVYKSYVAPEFRGKNILKQILHHFIKNKITNGESMFCFISTTNNSSIKAFEKTGFQKAGALTFLNRKQKFHYTISSTLKNSGIELYKETD
jgi:L-amino acid N-acyltransferase YncA